MKKLNNLKEPVKPQEPYRPRKYFSKPIKNIKKNVYSTVAKLSIKDFLKKGEAFISKIKKEHSDKKLEFYCTAGNIYCNCVTEVTKPNRNYERELEIYNDHLRSHKSRMESYNHDLEIYKIEMIRYENELEAYNNSVKLIEIEEAREVLRKHNATLK